MNCADHLPSYLAVYVNPPFTIVLLPCVVKCQIWANVRWYINIFDSILFMDFHQLVIYFSFLNYIHLTSRIADQLCAMLCRYCTHTQMLVCWYFFHGWMPNDSLSLRRLGFVIRLHTLCECLYCLAWLITWYNNLLDMLLLLKIQDNLLCPRPAKIRSALENSWVYYAHQTREISRYCLTQWISKLPGSFEIHWVRHYLVIVVYFE